MQPLKINLQLLRFTPYFTCGDAKAVMCLHEGCKFKPSLYGFAQLHYHNRL